VNKIKPTIAFEDFTKIDIRIGTITEVSDFPEARKPAYQLTIDFGDLGIKKTSAQITKIYSKKELVGKKVNAVINFKPMKIVDFNSDCLVLGIQNGTKVVLLNPSQENIKNGEQVS